MTKGASQAERSPKKRWIFYLTIIALVGLTGGLLLILYHPGEKKTSIPESSSLEQAELNVLYIFLI